jgi:RNA polymerase sigma-70 factor (ECF subfamily)
MLVAPHIMELGQEQAASRLDVTAIFKLHHGFVWRVLAHLGVVAAEQEDALQEVFVVVHRRLHEYREQDKMRAWLYAIAARVARDYRRRVFRRREQLTDAPPETSQAPSQAADAANRQALVFAERLLATLPDKQRAVFLLYEVEQMPMAEVALAVGCPVPTAYARLRKARERVLTQVSRAQRRGEAP